MVYLNILLFLKMKEIIKKIEELAGEINHQIVTNSNITKLIEIINLKQF